jgi:hypothetical protein
MAASCPLAGGHVDCTLKAIQLDTLQFTDGKHKLFLRTDSFVDPKSSLITSSRFNGGTFSAGAWPAACCGAGEGAGARASAPGFWEAEVCDMPAYVGCQQASSKDTPDRRGG